MQPDRELSIGDLFDSADLPRGQRANDRTGVKPRTLIDVLRAIFAVGCVSDFRAIAAAASVGRNTVERAVQVLVRMGLLLPPETMRERGRIAGKRYRINWTELARYTRDERLPLFAARLAAAELHPATQTLNPVAEALHPVTARLHPVAGNGGRGGSFLAAQQQTENFSPPPPPSASAHGVQASRHGVQTDPAGSSEPFERTAWAAVDRQLQQAGAISPQHRRAWCQAAHSRGMQPADLAELVAFYVAHAGAWTSPAVIGFAIDNWPPLKPGDLWSLFPTPKVGHDPESERRRAAKAAADAEEARAAAETDALNAAASAEGEQRFGPLIDAADEATRASAIELVDPDWRKFVAERWKPGRRPAGVVRDILLRDLSKRPPT